MGERDRSKPLRARFTPSIPLAHRRGRLDGRVRLLAQRRTDPRPGHTARPDPDHRCSRSGRVARHLRRGPDDWHLQRNRARRSAHDGRAARHVCKAAVSSGASKRFTWVGAKFLEKPGGGKVDLPIWSLADGETRAFHLRSAERARKAGLPFRAVQETVQDTLAWWKTLPSERQARPRAGPSTEREAELLRAWRALRTTLAHCHSSAPLPTWGRMLRTTPADVAPLEEPGDTGDDPSMTPLSIYDHDGAPSERRGHRADTRAGSDLAAGAHRDRHRRWR